MSTFTDGCREKHQMEAVKQLETIMHRKNHIFKTRLRLDLARKVINIGRKISAHTV